LVAIGEPGPADQSVGQKKNQYRWLGELLIGTPKGQSQVITQPGTILRHVRATAARDRSDEELLRAFAQRRDDEAFAALVQRHGRLVLRVCRSALRHEQDAEDAFQATFLLLARKAGSIKKGTSLAAWLHGVAHRLTMQVKRNAGRRRAHEQRMGTMARHRPGDELSWREVEGLFHEEVGRLPAGCRAAFVLCGLEGVSLRDASRQLGLRESTVSSRLAQARRLLRARLTRRGVSLAGVLGVVGVAALTGGASAAVRPSLVRITVELALSRTAARAATGTAARVVTLAEKVEQMMFTNKLKLKVVTSLLLGLGLTAAGLGTLAVPPPGRTAELLAQAASAAPRPGPQKDGRQPDPPPRVAPKEGESPVVKGRVLSPDGKAVAKAEIYLGHYGPENGVAVTRTAETGADGRFEFSFPKGRLSKAPPDPRVGYTFGAFTFERYEPRPADEADPFFTPLGQVMAVADGYGCDWARLDPAAGGAELTLRLVKDVEVNGRILDPEGQPVAGAKLRLSSLNGYPDEDPTDALAAFRKANQFPAGAKRWGGPLPGPARVTTTGPDGRFRLSGLGGNRFVQLRVDGPGIASDYIRLLTRAGDDVRGPDLHHLDNPPRTVYGATVRYLAATARPVRGVVTDQETGKPLAGATVRVQPHQGGLPGNGTGMLSARTDGDGRYEVLGCAKAPGYDLVVQPADAGPHFDVLVTAVDAPGVGPLTVDVKLPRGIPARGKVRDGRTGKPVAGARVCYFALHPNAATRLFNDYTLWDSGAVTGADGSFALPVLPGPGLLIAAAPDSTPREPSAAVAAALMMASPEVQLV
jgi:RNA polymerase sigma factor (sigma-70 family)